LQRKLYILSGILSVLILVNAFFIFSFPDSGGESSVSRTSTENTDRSGRVEPSLNNSQAYIFPISESSYLPTLNTAVEKPLLAAKSAVIYDTRSSRFLYSKNPDTRLPIASLTKLLTGVVVLENLNPEDIVQVSKESVKVDSEKQTLFLDENIKVKDLMKMMLIESSNDAAYALTQHASGLGYNFLDLMNKKAVELGMNNSIFHDPAGLNDDASSTSEDLVKLVKYSFKFDEIWSILSEKNIVVYSVDGKIAHQINSTNQLLGVIPDVVGGKTGYTDIALGNMILAVDVPGEDDRIISIVLGSTERFTDTQKLIDWVKKAYSWK